MLAKFGIGLRYYLNRRLIIGWIFFFVLILSIFWIISRVALIWIHDYCCDPISYVIVTGNRYFTTNNDINHLIVQLDKIGSFITQDVNVIQRQIKKLPWIKQISVRKQWPDTLKIHIVEYIPVGYWNNELIISTTGIMFKAPKHRIKNGHNNDEIKYLPFLYGPDGSEQDVLNNYLIFQAILQSHKFRIMSLKMDKCYAWQLTLQDNIQLRLGSTNLVDRLRYFIKVYPMLLQAVHKKNIYIDYVDLRYYSGCAVKWIDNVSLPVCGNNK
ncbi:cell division protein [Candidatus Blochmanniella vafra str. BVAF]|uniref:Cell division protein FtsQ n=1 Tax=Blochmanniella vafra (strain BVAF) TaxID=859654 RepID=E8Q5Q5_BLOVB|nr:cell division protein FtsQ/DivIB [Candidatus Blochmannia vafer]ADV33552.1 cell division protein [Candidatus Blochmannia vafer str. BVAF]